MTRYYVMLFNPFDTLATGGMATGGVGVSPPAVVAGYSTTLKGEKVYLLIR